MTLTYWEVEELIDHLECRPDIWTLDPDTQLWIRSNDDATPLCALNINVGTTGPFRLSSVRVVPLEWTNSVSEEYLTRLLRHWTSYNTRVEMAAFLSTDDSVHMDPALAMQVAVVLGRIGQEPTADPELSPEPVQQRLLEDGRNNGFPNRYFAFERRVFYLIGGGYASVSKRGEMLHVQLSIPMRGGGFSGEGQLAGFVRPINGSIGRALEMLFGDVPERDPQGLRPTSAASPQQETE